MEQTIGQKLVGLSFNPSGDATVNKLKQLFADVLDTLGNVVIPEDAELHGKLLETAVGAVITAQMWTVKVATFKE